MEKDTVELDLPPLAADDTAHPPRPVCEQVKLEMALVQERKRFDEERQQLRRQITALAQQNAERDQQVAILLEREKARVQQENLQLTSELFALRRQLHDQQKLQAENERLAKLAAEAQAAADALRQEAAAAARALELQDARVQELERALATLRRQLERHEHEPPARPLAAPPVPQAAPAIAAPAPQAPVPAAEPAAQDLKHSFHRSGNPIPVLVHQGDEEAAVSGWVLERSLGGLTLLLDQELPTGRLVHVKSARLTCTRPSWVAVQVKSSQPQGSSFQLCCRYPQQPIWEDIQQFW